MTSIRRVLWNVGAPARLALLAAIRTYQLTLSGWLGGQCRFSPTCSRYAEEAIRSLGVMRGSLLATRRVLRCNPFGRGGLDPVPQPKTSYDTNIRPEAESTLPYLIRRRHAG
ncbi:MAG TPA: membrane protein insertion efficiency factor YidD [Actinomycetota bacterium]